MSEFNFPNWLVYSPTYYLVVIDFNGKYSYVNPYFKHKFRHISDDFYGVELERTISMDDFDVCNEAVKKCIEDESLVERVYVRKPDGEGEYFWTCWDFSLYKNNNGEPKGILCVGHDITDLKLMTERSKKSEKKVLNQIAIMESIAWSQSHIVRKPLANILGLVNIILEEEDPKNQELLFKFLKESTEELDEVVKNIADKLHQHK